MDSDVKAEVAEAVETGAQAPVKEAAVATASASSKIPMLLGLLVLGVGAILAGRWYLDASVPTGGGEFTREAAPEGGAMARDKSMGFKPSGTSAAEKAKEGAEEKEDKTTL